MAIASIANWLFNFAIGFLVPPAFHNISWKTFIIFGVLCFAAAVQAYVSYPETARESLEEIEIMFKDGGLKPGTPSQAKARWTIMSSMLRKKYGAAVLSILEDKGGLVPVKDVKESHVKEI